MTYNSVSRYWFYRLDYELWKAWHLGDADRKKIWQSLPKDNQTLINNFRFRPCESVEHIIPQHPDIDSAVSEKTLHRFGNLALISGSRNSKFSNGGREAKKEKIESGTEPYTESLKMLHFLYCQQQELSDEDWVKQHEKLMYQCLTASCSQTTPSDAAQ